MQRAARVVGCTLALACGGRAMGVGYPIVNLDVLPGHTASSAYDVNDQGDVALISAAGFNARAARYSGGTLTNLGVLPGKGYSAGLGINAAGHVVGYSGGATGPTSTSANRAFMFANGVMTDLGVLPGTDTSEAQAINSSGQVTGYCHASGTSVFRAFVYQAGTMQPLNELPGSIQTLARDINDAGQIVGTAYVTGLGNRAFRYSDGVMTDIGGLPGSNSNGASGINDLGHVVGSSGSTSPHAFLYDGVTMTDLGVLPGTQRSFATEVNNVGEVVGHCDVPNDPATRAFLYRAGAMVDLNTLLAPNSGWVLRTATAINDKHWVSGEGLFNGQVRGYLLMLPEPSGVVGGAVVGLAAVARRRGRATSSRRRC